LLFRVAHSIRPKGTAAAGPQARAHAAAPAVRIRECMFAGACGAGRFALMLRTPRVRAAAFWPCATGHMGDVSDRAAG